MKQETGKTNIPETPNKVSIQLKLGGHSFSVESLPEKALREEVCVVCEVLTPRTLLVPAELFDPLQVAAWLAAAGMPPLDTETVVWSEPDRCQASNSDGDDGILPSANAGHNVVDADVVAVMAADADAIVAIRQRLGERAHFTSPLLCRPRSTSGVIWLRRAGELLYIKVWVDSLRLAEVLSLPTETEVLYLFEQLKREFTLENYELQITGDNSPGLRKLLSGYFRHTICE